MLIHHLWHSGGIRDFDETTGVVATAVHESVVSASWGFLWEEKGQWFAIRKDDQSLIFQSGQRCWRLDRDVHLSIRRGLRRLFEIKRGDVTEFQIHYEFRGALHAIIDPTYDAIDEESDDFFLYVTEMWLHWKDKDFSTFLKQ
jgi:hypothetical protein